MFFSINWAGSSRGREDDREKVNEKDAPFGDIIVEISHYLCCFYIHSNEIQSQHDIEGAWAIILQQWQQLKHSIRYVLEIHQNEFIRAAFFVHSWKINIPVLGVIKKE